MGIEIPMDKRKRLTKILEKFIFPCLLLIYPLLWVNQGIDVSDPMYSLTNFRFFPELKGSWAIATYLANVAGWLLMKLPFGGTLLGISFYTRLVISAMALLSYYFLKGKMPAWVVFAGEIIAISFCWCPTTILYNYLTYFLFLAVCILFAVFHDYLYFRGLWQNHGVADGNCRVCAGGLDFFPYSSQTFSHSGKDYILPVHSGADPVVLGQRDVYLYLL